MSLRVERGIKATILLLAGAMLMGCGGDNGGGVFVAAPPLERAGVVGVATARSGEPLAGGIVYFVPAGDVGALPATSIASDSADDEPLEDSIAANGATYQQAVVDGDGTYVLPTLAVGSYFVTFVPDAGDDEHLPGGSLCRTALKSTDLVNTRRDIQVSSVPPAGATYVGTGRCVTCHALTGIGKTMHRLGIWSPYETGALQDHTQRPELWEALTDKFSSQTTVYFYDYDSTRGFDKYKTAESDPGAGVSFTVTARESAGDYEMLLHNVANPADPDRVIRVDAIYGGGVWKQRYLTKIDTVSGFYYTTMPLQYQYEGSESSGYGRTSKTWRDYHGDWWYDEATKVLRTPAASKSFEKNCISCHAVGTQVTGSDATGWQATTISDATWGDFDYDGDGTADEMNLGCENCHGPGSAHLDAGGGAHFIVSPALLTPEREAMICGQCHSRPKGALGTDSPVNADGSMMIAGMSRHEFLANYATTQLDGATSDFYADTLRHSKSHHQQYSDFIRSKMYKNDEELLTCSTCHESHSREHPRQLWADPTDNDALCGSYCHPTQATNLAAHMQAELGVSGAIAAAKANSAHCTDCHMPKTAKTGAGRPGILRGGTQYWQNDVSSHIFDMPDKLWSQAAGQNMPTGYTNACGGCHQAP